MILIHKLKYKSCQNYSNLYITQENDTCPFIFCKVDLNDTEESYTGPHGQI